MYDTGANADTANVFDFAASDRLTIRDNGQCFQQSPGIAGRFFLEQARHPRRQPFPDLEAVAAGQLFQPDGPGHIVLGNGFQYRLDFQRIRLLQFRKGFLNLPDGHGFIGGKQNGFHDAFGIHVALYR